MTDQDFHKLQEDVAHMQGDIAEMKSLLLQLVRPAQSLSIKEKARAVLKARATGDRRVMRETVRQINGE